MSTIDVENVSVNFPVQLPNRSFRRAIAKVQSRVGGSITQKNKDSQNVSVTALDDISFRLRDGDRLGLIGHNGSGKTTLLRLLAGIYTPSIGEVRVDGKVSALFAAGLGMDPEDSGYENILTCGLYLGMTPDEIKSIVPDIEAFTELGDYLELPVRTYSSGMMVRLAFAITTALHPEILLLDEGLGAGDARFAEKAKQRVNSMVDRANILVLASHSDDLIRKMCQTCILLERGKVMAYGDVDEILKLYSERREQ